MWGHSGGIIFEAWGHRVLTEMKCRNAKGEERDRKLFDSGGLHLLVKPTGYKSWRLKYRFGGKEKQLTFGAYPLISLKVAREMRDEAKRTLLSGIDPGRKMRDIRARRSGTSVRPTVKSAALRWHALQKQGWKPRHAQHVMTLLEQEIFPELGEVPLDELTINEVREAIEAIQARGAIDQARRMQVRLAHIFDLAIVDGSMETNPAAPLKQILKPLVKRKYPAILQIDAARKALRDFEAERHWPQTKLASRLLALTGSRPGPLRSAQAGEFFDLDGAEPRWVVPAGKMKLGLAESEQAAYDFTVPLSRQTVELVKLAIEEADGRPYLFPGPARAHRPITENTLGKAYRDSPAFSGRHVPHGWRSTFSTIMNERASDLDRAGDRAVIDLMLGHKPSGVEATYNRAAYMKRRREIAQEWADLLCEGLAPIEDLTAGPRN